MSGAGGRSGAEDAQEIYSRLFNHRPFVQGELKHFVREFERKRGDREVEALLDCQLRVSELRDLGLPGLLSACRASNTPSILANTQVAESLLGRIQEQADTGEAEKTLVSSREAREKEWVGFLQEAEARCKKIDQSFREQEEAIRKKYQDLESLPS